MSLKQRILDEIRRVAEANGGVPPGRGRFSQESGIKDSDWRGKLWARWSDAVREAGFQPNQLQIAYSEDFLIEKFIGLARDLGRLPVGPEIDMRARSGESFPWANSFVRFGSKDQLLARVREYCRDRPGYEDVSALCPPVVSQQYPEAATKLPADAVAGRKEGYVYLCLLKLGREKRYKIGNAVLVERRTDQISMQLPAELELVHTIATDDAYGIEGYWHRRFAAKTAALRGHL